MPQNDIVAQRRLLIGMTTSAGIGIPKSITARACPDRVGADGTPLRQTLAPGTDLVSWGQVGGCLVLLLGDPPRDPTLTWG